VGGDFASRLIISINPLGNRTTTVYDFASRPTNTINPLGFVTTSVYDNDGRRIAAIDSIGSTTTTVYEPAGNLTQVTNPQNKTTTTVYDPLNRPAQKQMASGAVVSQTWDAAGWLITLANFGSLGALVNCFTYTYDVAYNRLTMTEARGSQTVWTYDRTRQLLAEARTRGIATIAWVPLSGPSGKRSASTTGAWCC